MVPDANRLKLFLNQHFHQLVLLVLYQPLDTVELKVKLIDADVG
jgi:hypothetical protein